MRPLMRHGALRTVVLLINVGWPNWYASFNSHTPVEARQAHPVAECVRQYARVHIARTQIQECGEEAEQRGVCELEQRA